MGQRCPLERLNRHGDVLVRWNSSFRRALLEFAFYPLHCKFWHKLTAWTS
jgi:hypothetical protein